MDASELPFSRLNLGAITIGDSTLRFWFCIAVNLTPWLFLSICAYLSFVNPNVLQQYILLKDTTGGGGLVEKATVAVLLVGICYGIGALIFYRKVFPTKLHSLWAAGWCLACIYFAGEEASWGQWYFGWETPEAFVRMNKQNETNFHNTSSWLNEKPRMLVELWLVITGTIIPVFFMMRRKKLSPKPMLNGCNGSIQAFLVCPRSFVFVS